MRIWLYRRLFRRYCNEYSYGHISFQELEKKLRRLNEHFKVRDFVYSKR